MITVLLRGRKGEDTEFRGGGQVKIEQGLELGHHKPGNAKDFQPRPGARGRGTEWLSLRASRRSQSNTQLDLGLRASQTMKE